MSIRKSNIFFLAFILVELNTAKAQIIYSVGGQPADTPRLFLKGLISDGLNNRDFTISPKGNEIFFTLQQPHFASSTILRIVALDGKWGRPHVAPFSGMYRDLEASFSADGQTIFFSSDRPVKNGVVKKDFDIWVVHRKGNGEWGTPENAGPIVNSNKDEFYPSVAKNGNLYFTAEPANGHGKEDIVMCAHQPHGYDAPVSLPPAINSAFEEFNAFIDPDEQFIVFSSYGRNDDLGQGDLYISHKDSMGHWTLARHLPEPINSNGLDYCPFVSWDKKYFIFTSNRINPQLTNGRSKTYGVLRQLLCSPGNGSDDIYWMKSDKIW